MAITNHERVGKALDLLKDGLQPFVERELKAQYQQGWFEELKQALPPQQLSFFPDEAEARWDIAAVLAAMWGRWNEVFRKTLGQAERTLVSELREVRNRWAHQRPFSHRRRLPGAGLRRAAARRRCRRRRRTRSRR